MKNFNCVNVQLIYDATCVMVNLVHDAFLQNSIVGTRLEDGTLMHLCIVDSCCESPPPVPDDDSQYFFTSSFIWNNLGFTWDMILWTTTFSATCHLPAGVWTYVHLLGLAGLARDLCKLLMTRAVLVDTLHRRSDARSQNERFKCEWGAPLRPPPARSICMARNTLGVLLSLLKKQKEHVIYLVD